MKPATIWGGWILMGFFLASPSDFHVCPCLWHFFQLVTGNLACASTSDSVFVINCCYLDMSPIHKDFSGQSNSIEAEPLI